MKHTIAVLISTLIATCAFAADSTSPAIIPLPAKMERREGVFKLKPDTTIFTDSASQVAGEFLAARLRRPTGYKLEVRAASGGRKLAAGNILIETRDAKSSLGSEGYELTVGDAVVIRAPEQGGAFYGVQTLLQLLPSQGFGTNVASDVAWTIPGVQIEDQPRFKWRGLMLDVSRHFFDKQEVMQLLDTMALHKVNVFHWHLVDDHGWRIEIKKYPKLTQIGAWRSDVGFKLDPKSTKAYGPDGRYGGFYTQDDIREIVAYAHARHITVVPEIEMPGHSIAVLAAFPELSCSGQPRSTDVPAGVHAGVYCAGKDEPFEFIQNVLTEVIDLFPSQYIHIGGDEVPKGNWQKCERCQARIKAEGLKNEHQLQSYFIRRIEKFVTSKGRNLIGWSEIAEGGLAPSAAVMDWIGGAVEAASAGHDVVMSPTSYCYLDYYQSQNQAAEPRAIGGFVPLSKVYSFEPVPAKLAAEQERHILGAQGNVWTEYIASFKHVQYMAYPRLTALAEVTWSPKASRNYEEFLRRLETQYQRFDQLGVNYRRETSVKLGEWTPKQINTNAVTLEWDVTKQVTAAGKGRVSLNYTKGAHGLRVDWVALSEDGREVARDGHAGFTGANPKKPIYTLDLPTFKPGARYTVRAQVVGDGGTDSFGTVNWELNAAK